MLPPTDERTPLVHHLQVYCAGCSEEQRETAQKMLNFVTTTPHCFSRSHTAGHMTGSAWLLNAAGDKVLLTLHRKLHKWLQPGGHADGEPDLLRVSLREAEEESGITGIVPVSTAILDVDIHPIPARPGEPAHVHYDVRYLLRAPHEDFAISAESLRLAWFRFDELAALTPAPDDSVLRLARKAGEFLLSRE